MSIGFTNYQSKNKQPSTLLTHTQLAFEHMFLVIDIDLWLRSFMLRRARTGRCIGPTPKQFTEIDLRLESFQDQNRRNKSELWGFLGIGIICKIRADVFLVKKYTKKNLILQVYSSKITKSYKNSLRRKLPQNFPSIPSSSVSTRTLVLRKNFLFITFNIKFQVVCCCR